MFAYSRNGCTFVEPKQTEIMTKYSKLLGQVEIISDNGTVSKVLVIKTGETKFLHNQFSNLQDTPFAKEIKKVTKPIRKITREEEITLAENPNFLIDLFIESRNNYRNGKSGMKSLTK